MTITHPRGLPLTRFDECSFVLDPGVAVARHGRGLAGTVSQVREPQWAVRFQTPRLSVMDAAKWQSWLNTQRGGLNRFLAWDVFRAEPFAYPAGVPAILAATWDGEATVSSLATAGVIAAAGLPAGYQATQGDRVGLVEGGRYGYFEISADAVANGSGAISLEIEPQVQAIFTSAAIVVLRRPLIMLQLDPASVSAPQTNDPGSISFNAAQVI